MAEDLDDDAEFASGMVSDSSSAGGDLLPVSSFENGGVTDDVPHAAPAQQGMGSQIAQQAQAIAEPTIRDYLRSNGIVQDFPDDYSAVNHLIRESREAAQLRQQQQSLDAFAQIGRQLAPQAPQLQKFLEQQAQPAGRKPWEPPPFDKRWAALVQMDPASGVYVAKSPGTPNNIVDAANEYAKWLTDFQDNPAAMMQGMVADREQALEAKLTKQIEERFQRSQLEQQTQGIVQQNAAWFYSYDQQGRVMRDPITGGPLASPVGQQYLSAVQLVASMGVSNPVHRDSLAKALLRDQITAASVSTQGNPNPATPAQRRAQATGRPNRNPLQALSAQERRETPRTVDPDTRFNFAENLRSLMRQEGITDDDFMSFSPTGTG